MVKILKKPLFKTNFPRTNFVVGELPRNYSVPPVTFPGNSISSYLSDDCNTVITLDSTHPYLKVPPLSIVTRNPYCRKPLPPPQPEPPTSNYSELPAIPPPTSINGFHWIMKDYDLGDTRNGIGSYYDGSVTTYYQNTASASYGSNEKFLEIQEIKWQDGEILGNYLNADYTLEIVLNSRLLIENSIVSLLSSGLNIETYISNLDRQGISYSLSDGTNVNSVLAINQECKMTCRYNHNLPRWMQSFRPIYEPENNFTRNNIPIPEILGTSVESTRELLNPYVYTNYFWKTTEVEQVVHRTRNGFPLAIKSKFSPRDANVGEKQTDFYGYDYWVSKVDVIKASAKKHTIRWIEAYQKPDEPPPPPPPMSCCPNVRENDALLRLILKRIGTPLTVNIRDYDETTKGYQAYDEEQKTLFNAVRINTNRAEVINDIVGIAEYPITAPKSIIEDYRLQFPEEIDDLWGIYDDEAQPIELKNLTQFLNWQVEQESAVMGGWHQLIKYEKDGKIETVRLVNIAETLKELIIIQAGQNKDNSLIVDLLLRVLTDLISIKSNVIRSNYIVEDIQDYLDYPTKEKKVDFPISITTPEKGLTFVENETIKRVLKPSIVSTTYQDWTGKNSLHDKLLDLLQGAAAIRGAFTESGEEMINISKGGDTKAPDPFQDWTNSLGE
jgi:hypothetical protein